MMLEYSRIYYELESPNDARAGDTIRMQQRQNDGFLSDRILNAFSELPRIKDHTTKSFTILP
jgi:hypothetical protein